MAAAGGSEDGGHRASQGCGDVTALHVAELSGWLINCPLPQTHLNQLCLAWLSQHHPGSCQGPRALGKVSGLLQNTLELYLTPGSRPNQKYIGRDLQPSSNKPGGWRRKAALHHSPESLPTPPPPSSPLTSFYLYSSTR